MLRSAEAASYLIKRKLTVLPTSRDILGHYYHIRQVLMDIDPRFLRKLPSFNVLKM